MNYAINAAPHRRPMHRMQRRNSSAGSLLPTYVEIGSLAALLVFYLVVAALWGEDGYPIANFVGSVCLAAILGYGGWRMVTADGMNLWTALFWFRLSTAIYFGFGTAFVYFANEASLFSMRSFYQFYDGDVFKLNLIVALSTLLVLIAARVTIFVTRALHWAPRSRKSEVWKRVDRRFLAVGLIFLGVGLFVKYVFVMPYLLGWSANVLPGTVLSLVNLAHVGMFFITLWGRRNARWLLPAIFALVAVEILSSLLLFQKTSMIFLLVMVSLAFLWDKVTVKKLLIVTFVILGAYFASKPIVDYGRHEIGLRYGADTQAGFGERLDIFGQAVTDSWNREAGESVLQGGLMRLSYVNAATFVIDLYDNDQASNWPELIPAVFIPRFLWPEKPIITAIGLDIYELSTGRRTSSSGAGIFAESYWAYGWWGVVIFMSVYGVFIGILTRFSSNVMREGRWLYFPVVLMTLKYGMRTDGHYISDVAGALVILVAFYVLLRILEAFMISFSKIAHVR